MTNKEKKPSTTTFTYHDPGRNFDGDPYEAAGKAVVQVTNVLKLVTVALHDTRIQVRNAYLQRNLEQSEDPNAQAWEDSPEAKTFDALESVVEKMQKKLTALHRAATYDPSAPLPKD